MVARWILKPKWELFSCYATYRMHTVFYTHNFLYRFNIKSQISGDQMTYLLRHPWVRGFVRMRREGIAFLFLDLVVAMLPMTTRPASQIMDRNLAGTRRIRYESRTTSSRPFVKTFRFLVGAKPTKPFCFA